MSSGGILAMLRLRLYFVTVEAADMSSLGIDAFRATRHMVQFCL